MKNNNTKPGAASVISAVAITVIVLTFLAMGGRVEYHFDDSSFVIHTTLWKDRTVAYADIESIELRDDLDIGTRTNGYGSWKLQLGTFRNAEFGTYQLYAYTRCNSLIVLYLKDQTILVVGGEEASASNDIYEAIYKRL